MKRNALMLLAAMAGPAWAGETKPMAVSPEAQATYKDIEASMGAVPGFFKAFPESGIAGAWEQFKNVSMNPNSAIPGKYKDLIALGVSAQIPCKYCIYAHTEFAKLEGATDAEIKEILAEASLTRQWSTWLNGTAPDETAFKAEIAKVVEAMKKMMAQPPPAAPAAPMEITDAKSALKDIEGTFGSVPSFMRSLPEAALPGAWKEMRAIELSPGPVPDKYVSLTSLAVAAQIPCRYCVIADTEFAKLGGTTEAEVKEAILVSALVRHWSTFLNGIQYDEAKYRKEIDQVVAGMKKKMAAEKKTAAK